MYIVHTRRLVKARYLEMGHYKYSYLFFNNSRQLTNLAFGTFYGFPDIDGVA